MLGTAVVLFQSKSYLLKLSRTEQYVQTKYCSSAVEDAIPWPEQGEKPRTTLGSYAITANLFQIRESKNTQSASRPHRGLSELHCNLRSSRRLQQADAHLRILLRYFCGRSNNFVAPQYFSFLCGVRFLLVYTYSIETAVYNISYMPVNPPSLSHTQPQGMYIVMLS